MFCSWRYIRVCVHPVKLLSSLHKFWAEQTKQQLNSDFHNSEISCVCFEKKRKITILFIFAVCWTFPSQQTPSSQCKANYKYFCFVKFQNWGFRCNALWELVTSRISRNLNLLGGGRVDVCEVREVAGGGSRRRSGGGLAGGQHILAQAGQQADSKHSS